MLHRILTAGPVFLACACALLRPGTLWAAAPGDAPAEKPAVVSHVKVLSDKVPDLSSLEAWKKAFVKDGMSDQEKALLVWKTVAAFQHQDAPPLEFLQNEDAVYEPIKMFNVYGYAMCSPASAHISGLSRYLGLKARGWAINCHSVPEVQFEGTWHLLDASLINYFPMADGKIAGVEELIAGVKAWLPQHPDLLDAKGKPDNNKLYKYMKEMPPGWKSGPKGWSRGPDVLLRSPTMNENGWHPAKTHGWYSSIQEYDGSTQYVYEYLPTLGYEVNVQLRDGERIVRNWSHQGLHVNMDGAGGAPGCIKATPENIPTDFPHWSLFAKEFGPNLAPGRVGNGTHEYRVPLASGAFRRAALAAENLAAQSEDQAAPALHLKDAGKPGVLVLRMPSSYVYLSGMLSAKTVIPEGGEILVEVSDNHGLSYKPAGKLTASGEQTVDLKPLVYRRYDYRLRLTLKGKGTGLDALALRHDIQHSQRVLPALDAGTNKISFSSGAQEGTVTLDGNFRAYEQPRQRLTSELNPVLENATQGDGLAPTGSEGSATFTVEAPGEITRVRMSGACRNWGPDASWDFQVSFDGGKSFKTIGTIAPQAGGNSHYAVLTEVPKGTKTFLARYLGHKKSETRLYAFAVYADYREPHGGFRPVKVTYAWSEDGQEKQDAHVAKSPEETWTIECAKKPLMKSIKLELAE